MMKNNRITRRKNSINHRSDRRLNLRRKFPPSKLNFLLLATFFCFDGGRSLWSLSPSREQQQDDDDSYRSSVMISFASAEEFSQQNEIRNEHESNERELAEDTQHHSKSDHLKKEVIESNSSEAAVSQPSPSFRELVNIASSKALGGGISGALAGVIQVITLMWLRTIVNYQYRYGTTFMRSFHTLNGEGGIRRFYRGLHFALIQAPLSRFVSTFSNDGVQSLMEGIPFTSEWGPARTTAVASIFVGVCRMALAPIDTCKTVLQVDSKAGFKNLVRRVKTGEISALYQGALATSLASIVGHYPWFLSFNYLSKSDLISTLFRNKLLKNAMIGLFSSVLSDTTVNAIRVVKTTKQSVGSKYNLGYTEAIRMIVAADGWKGLFGRGLKARIAANALQSIMFTTIWRGLAERNSQSSSSLEQETEAGEEQTDSDSNSAKAKQL